MTNTPPRTDLSSRRSLLAGAALLATAGVGLAQSPAASSAAGAAASSPPTSSTPAGPFFGLCLNTSTIRGANLGLDRMVEVAAAAGFQAIEPWLGEIEAFEKKGGVLKDLGKKIRDLGLVVPSAIGFAKWIINDDAERAKGLEQMKRDMDKVSAIGGTAIAAPPVGATKAEDPDIDLRHAAERYRKVCEIGDQTGVVPQVEVWGFSKTFTRLADAAFVAIESGHPKACILPDVYHLHKGGSSLQSLRLLNPSQMPCFHINDYPADPPRETITDGHRVYPGDGVAPIADVLRTLAAGGFRGYLSLELFNKDYWKQPAEQVAATGVARMKASIAVVTTK